MKRNKRNPNRKYDYVLIYVENDDIAGDYFEFDNIKQTFTLLNKEF